VHIGIFRNRALWECMSIFLNRNRVVRKRYYFVWTLSQLNLWYCDAFGVLEPRNLWILSLWFVWTFCQMHGILFKHSYIGERFKLNSVFCRLYKSILGTTDFNDYVSKLKPSIVFCFRLSRDMFLVLLAFKPSFS
jgi:hypothetical protein